jgi:hypothetical protein
MEKEIKVMTNIVKQTLVEKQNATLNLIDDLVSAEGEIIAGRVKNAFKDALDYLPAEVTTGYDSVYFKVEGKEILNISTRYSGGSYLNTYATTIDNDFELRRLVFNGMIAKAILENPNTYKEIFADTELKAEIAELREQMGILRREIEAIADAEKAQTLNNRLERLKNGEEIQFEKLKTIQTGYHKDNSIHRVTKMKAEWISKKKVNITFTCKSWYDETPDVEYKKEGINEKYLLQAIH